MARKKKKQAPQSREKCDSPAIIGWQEAKTAIVYDNAEDRTLPQDGHCRYCGEPKGCLWPVDKGVWRCGHCLREYGKVVNDDNSYFNEN